MAFAWQQHPFISISISNE